MIMMDPALTFLSLLLSVIIQYGIILIDLTLNRSNYLCIYDYGIVIYEVVVL